MCGANTFNKRILVFLWLHVANTFKVFELLICLRRECFLAIFLEDAQNMSPSNCKWEHSYIKDKICMSCYKIGVCQVLINDNEDCHNDASISLPIFKHTPVHCLLFVINKCWNSHKPWITFLMWLDSFVQNAVFKSIIVQKIYLQECLTCKILFILSPCLHSTKQLRNLPMPVLAESFPDSVNNCEKQYFNQLPLAHKDWYCFTARVFTLIVLLIIKTTA